jgi:hypothetical protein
MVSKENKLKAANNKLSANNNGAVNVKNTEMPSMCAIISREMSFFCVTRHGFAMKLTRQFVSFRAREV